MMVMMMMMIMSPRSLNSGVKNRILWSALRWGHLATVMIFYFSLRLLISSLNASLSARGSGAAWVLWPNCMLSSGRSWRRIIRLLLSSDVSLPGSRATGVPFCLGPPPSPCDRYAAFSRIALQARSCKHLTRAVTLEPRERNDEALQFDNSAHVTGVVTTWPEGEAVARICGPTLCDYTLPVCVCVYVHACAHMNANKTLR